MKPGRPAKNIRPVMRALARAIDGLDLPAVEKISQDQAEDPFQVLIATLLSARTQDSTTLAASKRLFKVARTPRTMARLTTKRIERLIYPVSFYRHKARHVRATCRLLVERFGGRVPMTMDDLLTLPGVGRKTANVVLSMAFGIPALAVDTHIFRIGNRLKIAPGKTPDEVEQNFLRIIPEKYLFHAHHWLILHGRYTCKARKPECERCVIADLCKSPDKTWDIPAELVELPQQVI